MKWIVLAFLIGSTASSAMAENPPDYSDVTSRDAVQALFEQGELVAVLLFPEEFGGGESDHNVVFVPAAISEAKDKNTATLVRYVEEDLIDQLEVNPTYKGSSLVPSTIVIKAWHSNKDGAFNTTIEVW